MSLPVKRIAYSAGARPPVAAVVSDKTGAPLAATVSFTLVPVPTGDADDSPPTPAATWTSVPTEQVTAARIRARYVVANGHELGRYAVWIRVAAGGPTLVEPICWLILY